MIFSSLLLFIFSDICCITQNFVNAIFLRFKKEMWIQPIKCIEKFIIWINFRTNPNDIKTTAYFFIKEYRVENWIWSKIRHASLADLFRIHTTHVNMHINTHTSLFMYVHIRVFLFHSHFFNHFFLCRTHSQLCVCVSITVATQCLFLFGCDSVLYRV